MHDRSAQVHGPLTVAATLTRPFLRTDLAVGGSGCLQCLELFQRQGMSLAEGQYQRLYPGCTADVFFRLLEQMQSRQMVLASTLLRHRDEASLQSSMPGCDVISSGVPSLSNSTVTYDELHGMETEWRSRWFSLLLLMGLDPNLRAGSGETLLMAASRAGFSEIVRLLLEAGADVRAVASGGRDGTTALHLAASHGYLDVAAALLGAGADRDATDSVRRTPSELVPRHLPALRTLVGGASAGVASDTPLSEVDVREKAIERKLKGGELWSDGWAEDVASEFQPDSPGCADIDVVSNISLEVFLRDYYMTKPLLIRGAAADRKLTAAEFSELFGAAELKTSKLPYGPTYGVPGSLTSASSFLKASMTGAPPAPADGGPPDYVFDDEIFRRSPRLLAGLRGKRPWDSTEAVARACNNVKQQLIVGPMRSAAHFHFHQDAFNVLYVGQKRWWLVPPGSRFASNEHLTAWKAGSSAPAVGTTECMQDAGDAMYVPHMWTHAVANVRASVAVATEFSDCDLQLARVFGWQS